MKLRVALASLAAIIIGAIGFGAPAFAGANDNNNASVAGVSSQPAAEGCPYGNFCLYTGPSETGRMFVLYYCQEYALYDWGGIGSYENNNSDGAHAWLRGRNHNNILNINPALNAAGEFIGGNFYNEAYDFRPVWFVQAC